MKRSIDARLDAELVEQAEPRVVLRRLSEIEARPVEWLWKNRIARGEPCIAAGVPGIGKSFFAGAIIAALTRGHALPGDDESIGPSDVLVLALEDDAGRVLRPRYEQLGADLTKVHIIDGVQNSDEDRIRPFRPAHAELLEKALDLHPHVRLIVVDPIASLIGAVDMGRSNEIRDALDPLFDVTARRNIAVLCIAHVNKQQVNALSRIEGSFGGFVGRARTVLAVGKDEETGHRGIGIMKSNLGPTDLPVIGFEIDSMGRFLWAGERGDLTPERLFAQATPEGADDRAIGGEVRAAILDALAPGPKTAKELDRYLTSDCGFAKRTVERVRSKLRAEGKIASTRAGFGAPVSWALSAISATYSAMSATHTCEAETADNGRTTSTLEVVDDDAEVLRVASR